MKKILTNIAFTILALCIGFIIGWRATVVNGIISVDKGNNHIGYFECWGYVDEYYIEYEDTYGNLVDIEYIDKED